MLGRFLGPVPGDWQLTTAGAVVVVWGCSPALTTDTEPGDKTPVTVDVVGLHIVQQAAAAADQLHQASPGVVVAPVHLEVLGEVVDPLSEDGNLYLGRTGIGLVEPVLGDRRRLVGHALRMSFLVVPEAVWANREGDRTTQRVLARWRDNTDGDFTTHTDLGRHSSC